jgi:hypothetical protein
MGKQAASTLLIWQKNVFEDLGRVLFNFSGVRTSKVVQNMYFNAIFVVGTSGLRLKSTIFKGPLLKSGVTPSRSSDELIISGYPAQSALKKSQFLSGLLITLFFLDFLYLFNF